MPLIARLRLAAALLLLSPVLPATAQTHIRVTTPSGACVITTDANGVSLDPATGDMVATGTASGVCGSGSGGGPTAPSITNPLEGDTPATTTTGTALNLSWSADADSCTYAGSSAPSGVSFANWPTTGTVCTSAATCATTHTVQVTPSVAGSYTFKLSCSRSGVATPATSSTATTVSNPVVSTGCIAPSGIVRQVKGTVLNYSGTAARTQVDTTQFANVWGFNATTGSVTPWPSLNGQLAELSLGGRTYVAAEFTVPSTYPTGKSGKLQFAGTNTGAAQANVSMTVSESCGDFRPGDTNPISPYCVLDNVPNTADGAAILWTTYAPGTYAYEHSCHLTAGRKYFLNITFAPLSDPANSNCIGICSVNIDNGPGNF